jgi:hypothetical protein
LLRPLSWRISELFEGLDIMSDPVNPIIHGAGEQRRWRHERIIKDLQAVYDAAGETAYALAAYAVIVGTTEAAEKLLGRARLNEIFDLIEQHDDPTLN